MTISPWHIPESTLHWIEHVPKDRPVAMLIRHSVRDYLPPGEMGFGMPITAEGRRLALDLGTRIGKRLQTLHASPTRRTVETAVCLGEAAELRVLPEEDCLLGHPGVFVVDRRATETWQNLGHEEVMRRLVEESDPPPGCADPEAAARFLVHHMLAIASGSVGLHAFVTHDSLVTTTAARLLQAKLTKAHWPKYLEAAFFWESEGEVHSAYQEHKARCSLPLTRLTAKDVIGLARREVAATVGLDCQARFFLAGGAFKSLLTGRPPRDLDVWAASASDRDAIVRSLIARGAERLPETPYNQPFRIAGRIVELPFKVDATSLEDRLMRFDLALSAVGVEHSPNDRWRAWIHPLAHESVALRRVLLLPELKNWLHCLTSIERLRRCTEQLNFESALPEENRLWSIFENQSREVQMSMVARFQKSTRGDQRVELDLERRGFRPLA